MIVPPRCGAKVGHRQAFTTKPSLLFSGGGFLFCASGYVIMRSMKINPDGVLKALGPHRTNVVLKTFDEIDSTNQWLCDHPPANTALVVASRQTRGRGRRGRVWQSPAGGVYFSVGQRLVNGRMTAPTLSLLIGIKLAEALAALGATDVQVKWPNDIVVNGQKLAGVLVEQTQQVLVVGVGLNWHSDPLAADLPNDRKAVGLAECLPETALPSIESVCGQLAGQVLDVLALPAEALEAFLAVHWKYWDALIDRPVTIEKADGSLLEGRGDGVTADGALRLVTDKGVALVHSGEARVKGGWEQAR